MGSYRTQTVALKVPTKTVLIINTSKPVAR